MSFQKGNQIWKLKKRIGCWSRRYDCCQKCGTTEIKHWAKGLCEKCYLKLMAPRMKQQNLINSRKRNETDHRRQYMKDYEQDPKNREIIKSRRQSIKYRNKRKEYEQSPIGKDRNRQNANRYKAAKLFVDFWQPWMTERWWWMIDVTEGYCPNCGKLFDDGGHKLTMDHIIPLNLVDKLGKDKAVEIGAIHHINNIQVLCKSCNSSKNGRII